MGCWAGCRSTYVRLGHGGAVGTRVEGELAGGGGGTPFPPTLPGPSGTLQVPVSRLSA